DYKAELEEKVLEEKPKSTEVKQTNGSSKPAKKKLSFKEQREIDMLETEIFSLEKEIAERMEQMNTVTDHGRLTELSGDIARLQQQLDDKTERWIALSELT